MAFPFQSLLETLLNTALAPKAMKKHSKKDKASQDVLDIAHASVKKFRKVTREIGKLSTGQKVVGGLVLAAAGLVYLAASELDDEPAKPEAASSRANASEAEAKPAPRKHAKRPRPAADEE